MKASLLLAAALPALATAQFSIPDDIASLIPTNIPTDAAGVSSFLGEITTQLPTQLPSDINSAFDSATRSLADQLNSLTATAQGPASTSNAAVPVAAGREVGVLGGLLGAGLVAVGLL